MFQQGSLSGRTAHPRRSLKGHEEMRRQLQTVKLDSTIHPVGQNLMVIILDSTASLFVLFFFTKDSLGVKIGLFIPCLYSENVVKVHQENNNPQICKCCIVPSNMTEHHDG